MASNSRNHYLAWLRDAHAMEKQALSSIEAQIPRLQKTFPDVAARLTQHHQETDAQLVQIQRVLERHDTDASMVKDLAATAMATTQALGGMLATDEPVKAALMLVTFEHLEIASYRCLISAAEVCGDTASVPIFEAILDEEVAMADWLEARLGGLAQQFLLDADVDAQAEALADGNA
jgi:ferritin-like metal-binding protein YciE